MEVIRDHARMQLPRGRGKAEKETEQDRSSKRNKRKIPRRGRVPSNPRPLVTLRRPVIVMCGGARSSTGLEIRADRDTEKHPAGARWRQARQKLTSMDLDSEAAPTLTASYSHSPYSLHSSPTQRIGIASSNHRPWPDGALWASDASREAGH